MALAAMYQRIPYSILSQVSRKKPQNYAVCKLPSAQNSDSSNDPASRSFEAARTQHGVKETAFARWDTITFPKDIDFESALESIETSNSKEQRAWKYKLTFTDGCHILLTRSNWEDPSTLYCTEAYDPNGAFNKMTQSKRDEFQKTEGQKRSKFLVDESGHLSNRRRDEDGNPINHHFAPPVETIGKAGFSFTPMSYISHQVRPNKSFPGVRPGLKDTNKTAYHFLKKHENQ